MRLLKHPAEVKTYNEVWRQAYFADDGVAYWYLRYYGWSDEGPYVPPLLQASILPVIHVSASEWVDLPEEELFVPTWFSVENQVEWWDIKAKQRGAPMSYHSPDLDQQWYEIVSDPLPFIIRICLSS